MSSPLLPSKGCPWGSLQPHRLSKPLPTQPSSLSPCSVLDHPVPTPCNFNQLCITLYYSKSLKFFFLQSRNSLRKGTIVSYLLAHLSPCMIYNRHSKHSSVPGLGKSPGNSSCTHHVSIMHCSRGSSWNDHVATIYWSRD